MFRKELRYYFSTPIAYIVIGLYLLAISLFLWVIPGQWNIIDSGYAQVDGLFQLSPWLFMLLCPALTMRLFSEERQSGMWDLIRTKPISLTRIVLGKYFAAWTLVLIGLLPCFVHYFVVAYMAELRQRSVLGFVHRSHSTQRHLHGPRSTMRYIQQEPNCLLHRSRPLLLHSLLGIAAGPLLFPFTWRTGSNRRDGLHHCSRRRTHRCYFHY